MKSEGVDVEIVGHLSEGVRSVRSGHANKECV